ncbi:hypothetical protein SAMN05443639_1201 [Stigmatella erecta]|uniref:Uncharacterized protein n=1 Tax=Stigmatella erecta TaxID=83460 RepID=A0A1I0L5U3_9BACT|nr:hypothetical protein SAMN05443639_1201 [Stigmatella erecta]
MASCHVREHRSQVRWPEGQRHGNAQSPAKLTVGLDQFSGCVDLGAGARRMIAKRDAGFRERRAARGAREQLHAEFRFEPGKLTADD